MKLCEKYYRCLRAFFLLAVLIAAGALWWYTQLDDRHKRYIQNLIRQIPDLPARFSV
jgi:hypothetical protein